MYTIEVKRTYEVTDKEIKSFYQLFESVFQKKREIATFREEFGNTAKGYSYHAIAKDKDRVIGHNVYVPFEYIKDGVEFLLALSVDAVVDPDYRGQGIYEKLLKGCEEASIKDGCVLRIGFPNQNSYPIQIKKFGYTEIGALNTYFILCNPGKLKKNLFFFKPLTYLTSHLSILLGSLLSSDRKQEYLIHKNREKFDKYRYKWFNGNYTTVCIDDFEFKYSIEDFKGIKAAFLIDFYPITSKNLNKAVKYIFSKEKNRVFGIIYVGNLNFFQATMFKIPYAISPKKFHLVAKILNDRFLSRDLFDIRNWELNLSNFDLI